MREARDLLARLRALRASGDARDAALATIVHVEGSAYRREGARLLIEGDGRLTGVVSGGCIERELAAVAREVTASGQARAVVFDLTADGEAIWGHGLGCEGRVTLAVEPVASESVERFERALARAIEARERTTVEVDWRAPAAPNGSGELAARRFVDSIEPPVKLMVLGAERDLVPLVRLGVELGWEVVVVDSRAGAGAPERFAGLAPFVVAPPRALGAGGGGGDSRLALDARTAVVVATHRYLDDLAWLRAIEALGENRSPGTAETPGGSFRPRRSGAAETFEARRDVSSFPPSMEAFGYLGLLGPERRRERLLADLGKQGIAFDRSRLHGPAGLALGGRAPEQVALAIVAEIQATFEGGSGFALSRERG